jgi:hypothetical protein
MLLRGISLLYKTRATSRRVLNSRAVNQDQPMIQRGLCLALELELELIQTQIAQKPMLRAEVHARALRASQFVKRAEVLVGARCA